MSNEQRKAIVNYLRAVDLAKLRLRPLEAILSDLVAIETSISDESLSPVRRLKAYQMRLDLQTEANTVAQSDLSQYEDDFVAHIGAYCQERNITSSALLSYGVKPAVLARAGLT